MKILLNFILFLFLISCQTKDDVKIAINNRPISVSFSLEGDISLEEETPIGGKSEGDLGTVYGVTINRIVDGNESFLLEGVFNSFDNINVDFYSDESYMIYFTALQDGTSLGLAYQNAGDDILFNNLFGELNLPLGNEFVEDSQLFYLQSNSMASYEGDGSIDNTSYNALIDRFDGKTEVIKPTESDSLISIQLRRVSFGLALRAENMDNNDTLNITLYSGAGSPYDYRLTNSKAEDYQIRTVGDNGFDIADDQTVILYSSFELSIYDDLGVFVRKKLLSTQDIIGKRNVKRTYVIDLNDFGEGTAGRNSIEIEYSDEDFINEGEFNIGG